MIDAIINTNTILVLLAVGTIIWMIRQILPNHIENHKVWKVVLRLLPVSLGAGIAMIPQLRPMTDMVQSCVIGGIAGSLSSSLYGVLREALGDKIKMFLGSKASRKAKSEEPEDV
jgi:hypothetical protein